MGYQRRSSGGEKRGKERRGGEKVGLQQTMRLGYHAFAAFLPFIVDGRDQDHTIMLI